MGEGALELSGLIQGHRRAQRLTQEELADRAGIGVRTLSDLERGVHPTARRSTVRRLAAALGLEGADLARFEAVAAGPDRAGTPVLPALFDPFPAGPFVGRRPELAVLRRAWDDAATRGRLVTLVGEPGIGKTRLAAELARVVATEGALVLAGRCDEHVVLPYGPLGECFSHLVRGGPPEPVSRSAGARRLAGLLPELVGAPISDPGRADGRPELPVAVSTALADVAAATRLLLVVDDLHWADRPTVLVLRHLARTAPPGVLVLATYQDAEVAPGSVLGGTLADLRRAGAIDRIPLDGLGLDDVAELLARCDRWRPRPELARSLVERTGGNPFFVGEVLHHIAETDADPDAVPDLVREVLATRLARLPEPVQRLLGIAAVLGPEFDVAALQALADVPEAVVLEGLDAAVGARVLEESRDCPGHHRFKHVLVRDALYEGLGRSRRAALHGAAGRVLEARVDAGEEAAAALARHLAAAGTGEAADRVLHYAVLAGDHARRLGAHHEAGDHYELAVGALAGAQDVEERRCELLLELGEARNAALERHRARPAFLEAARAARSLGRPDLLVRAAHGYGYMTKAGDTDGGVADLWRAALAEAGAGAGTGRSVLLAASATASMLAGEDGVDDLAAEALECARRSDDERALAMALATRSLVLWGGDAVEERLALATELHERGRARARTGTALDGLELRGVPLLELGRVAAFDETIERLLRLGGEVGKRISVAQATQWRALRALMAGRLEDAERLAAEVLELSGDAPNFAMGYAAQLYVTRRAQGRAEELLGGLIAYVEDHPDVPAWRALLAVAHAEAGRGAEAAAELDRLAASHFADVPRTWTRPVTLALASECAALLDDRERASWLRTLLAPRSGQLLVVASGTSCEGAVDRYLGALAATVGDTSAAEVHFTNALALEESVGGHALAVRTRLAHARALLRGPGRAGARAAALLDAAGTRAAALGMSGAVAEADALRART